MSARARASPALVGLLSSLFFRRKTIPVPCCCTLLLSSPCSCTHQLCIVAVAASTLLHLLSCAYMKTCLGTAAAPCCCLYSVCASQFQHSMYGMMQHNAMTMQRLCLVAAVYTLQGPASQCQNIANAMMHRCVLHRLYML